MDFNYVRQRDEETKETRQARKYIALKFMKAVKTTTIYTVYVEYMQYIYLCAWKRNEKCWNFKNEFIKSKNQKEENHFANKTSEPFDI